MPEKINASPGEHSRFFRKTITKEISAQYLVVLPENYNRNEKWPLIFFLHGRGERGDNLEKVKVHGPVKYAQQHKDFPFVLVSPQCPQDRLWWPCDVLINLLDEVVVKYNIDEKRIYLTGLSMGGFGVWDLGCRYPERFAAVAAVCGEGEPSLARHLKDVPVWAFHGAGDNVVPPAKSEEMVEAIKAAGGDAKLTIYSELGHDSWTVTYNDPALYDWFLKQTKKTK